MSRIILFYVLPFLLPFIAFLLYRLLVTRGQPLLQHTPWFLLSATGLGLVVVSLVTLALTGGWQDEGHYLPPRIEDGRIVPGEMLPPPVDSPDDDGSAAPGSPDDS